MPSSEFLPVRSEFSWVEVGALETQAVEARRAIVRIAAGPTGCHLGGSLSVVDLLVTTLAYTSRFAHGEVVLSKGHAAAALYAVLHARGTLTDDPALGYGAPESILTGHPNHHVPGVRFPTGSLGHGLAYALGWAMANAGDPVVAIVGDGELQEGLIWESLQAAAAQAVGNLIVVVDKNDCQNDGHVADISPMSALPERLAAFGCRVTEVDGHDPMAVLDALCVTDDGRGKPLVVIAHTIKGRGIRELERIPSSHYVVASPAQETRWLEELA